MKRILQGLMVCTGLATSLPASAQTIYSNNFSGGLSGFTTTGAAAVRTDNGVAYLGNLGQGATARLTISTAGYTNVRLAFTLFGVLSVDGNGPAGGAADPFVITDNSGTIFDYTFANFSGGGNTQSYGGPGQPVGSYAPRTGQASCNDLGFGCGDFGDARYVFSNLVLTPNASNSLTLTFTGNTNEDVANNEFYGIDNVLITGTAVPTSAVPEPATFALMAGGLALVGVVARRRRAA